MGKQRICFKRWTRKNYGGFASLKKVVKIGVLTTCSLVVFAGQRLLAQSEMDSMQVINLSEFEITEHRQQLYSNLTRIVESLSKDEIEKAPVSTLADLLRYVSSVDVRQRGANGVQSDVSSRGGTFDQMLVLLNGINITDPQTGHYNLDLPIDLSSIDRIEILQGPGSRVLGPNAFSGAINIITASSNKNAIMAQIEGGSHGYLSQQANGTLRLGKLTAFGALSNSRAEGYAFDTDFNITNAFSQFKLESKALGETNFQLAYQDKSYGAYGFYSLNPLYANQYEKTKTFFASFSNEKRWNRFSLHTKAYWRRHHDRFELFRDYENAYEGYQHNYHQTDVASASVSASYSSRLGKTSIGADYRFEHIYSNALGEQLEEPRKVPFESAAYFTKSKSRGNLNYFVEESFYFKRFSSSIGLLGNYNDDFGFNHYAGLDAGYSFSNQIKIYFSLNQSLRLPSFTDLYLENATQQGNVELEPERALSYELGLKYQSGKIYASAQMYYRAGRDVIDWVKFSASDVHYTAMNHAEINAMGADLSFEYNPEIFIEKIKLSYSVLTQDKQSEEYDSKYALDYLRNKVVLGLHHKIYKGFGAIWNLSYSDRAGTYTNADNEIVSNSPFFLVDFRVQWSNQKITLFGEASNLFDVNYADYGGIAQPGRWIKSGIKLNL